MIHLLRERASAEQIAQMREALEDYIKVAVDVAQGILAGGGAMHADCEAALLESGSRQEDVWGADWYPEIEHLEFESLINIRPSQDNPHRHIADEAIRLRVETIVRSLLAVSDAG